MKNFIGIFVLLFCINAFVPVLYYQFYYKTNTGSVNEFMTVSPDSSDISESDSQNYGSGSYSTQSQTVTYDLYNLATQEMCSMDVISFLVGCAACEMPAYYEEDAIKAQMVACHSYYLYCLENGVPHEDLNLSFDERYMQKYASKQRLQEYWGMSFNEYYEKFLRCANEVADFVLTYDKKAALTTYYAVSCGKTQTSENEWGYGLDYLQCVESPDDVLSDDYLKVNVFSADNMRDRLMTTFTGFELSSENPEEWFGEILYNESGYVTSVEVADVKITGQQLCRCLELPSACFMIFFEDGEFSVATKGYGHGVGLSQFGANKMAENGTDWKNILNHYFPRTDISKI